MMFLRCKNNYKKDSFSKLKILSVFIFILLIFSSCKFNSIIENPDELSLLPKKETVDQNSTNQDEEVFVISGSVRTNGAVPSDLASNQNNCSRTAYPQVTSAVFYKIKAVKLGTTKTVYSTATSTNPSYSLTLTTGSWNLTVTGYLAATETDCTDDTKIYESEAPTVFDTTNAATPVELSVYPITQNDTYGSVKLNVEVQDNEKIKSVKIEWKGSKNNKTGFQVLNFDAGTEVVCNFNSTYDALNPVANPFDIQADFYTVVFKFYSSASATGSIVYRCTEVVNIFQNMVTDFWVSSGTSAYLSSSGFKITNTCVLSFSRDHYYINGVNGSLDTTVPGTFTEPFNSLEQANNYITTNTGDLRKEKTLYFHVRADSSYSQPVTLADYKELVIIGENETSQKELKKISAQGRSTGDLFIKSNVKLDNILLEKTETFLDLDSPQKKLTLCNAATVNCSIKLANLTSKIYVDCSNYSDLSINLSYVTKPNKGEPIVYPLSGTLSSAVTDKFVFSTGNANILYDGIKNAGVFNRETDIYFNANSVETVANGSKQYPFKDWDDVSSNVESEDTVYLMSDVSNFSGFMCPVTICSYQDAANPTAVYSVNAGTALRINFQTQSSTAPIIVENINIDGNNKELWLSGSVNSGADYGVIFRNCRIENVTAVSNSAMAEFDSTEISAEKYYCGNNWHSTFKNSTATFTLFSLTKYNSGTSIKITDPDIKAWATFDSSSHLYADFINVSEPDSLTVYNLPQPVSAVNPVSAQNYTFVNYCDAVSGTTLINYTGSTLPDLSKLTAGNCSTSTSGTNYTIIQNPSDSTKLCAALSLKYFMDKNSTATYSNGSEFAPFQSLYALLNIVKNITLASPVDVIEIYLKSDSSSLSVSALTSFNKNLKICGVRDAANPDAMYKIDLSITTSTASTASPTIELENVLIAHANNANNPLINMKKGTLKLTNVAIENNDTKKSLVTMTSGNLIMTNVTIENKATGIVRSPLYLGSGTIAELNSVDINGFGTNSSQYSDSKGAIYCEGSLTYKDGIISDCRGAYIGAGITLSGSANALIEDVEFSNCSIGKPLSGSASGISQGGANIHVGDNAKLTIKGSTCGTVTKTSDSTYNYSNDIALTKNSAANFKVEGLTSASVCNLTLTTNFAVGDVLFNVLDEDSNTENLFTIVYPADNGWGSKYDSVGKTCVVGLAETVYTDWASLVAAVENIPSGTTEETEFVISGTLNADTYLINMSPIKITGKTGKSTDSIERAAGYKGKIFNPLNALAIENVSINGNNVANSASVIYASDVDLSLNEVEFINCKTAGNFANPEAVVCINDSATPVSVNISIKNTDFDTIASNYYGGAILCNSKSAKLTLEDVSATNCSAEIGGFMYLAAGDVVLSDVYIDYCSTATPVKESGGAICVLGGDSKLTLKCPEEDYTYGINSPNNTIGDGSSLDIAIVQSSTNGCPEFIIDGYSFIQKIYYYVDTQPEKPIYLNIDTVGYPIELEFSKTDFATGTYPVMQSVVGATCSLADGVACFTVINSGWSINNSGYLVSGASTPVSGLTEAPTTGTFSVSSVSEFNQLSSWVAAGSTMENVTLVIDSPVSITGTWTPIGTDTHPFKGTVDGNGQTIELDNNTGGLFGNVQDATIKNIQLKSSVNGSGIYVGGLVGKGSGVLLIENCTMDGYFSTNSAAYVGGIIGYVDGSSSDNIVIRNCFNKEGVNGTSYVGGIVGYISGNPNSVRIENCGNRGAINNSLSGGAGGILGGTDNTNVSIVNCFNQADSIPKTGEGSIAGEIPNGNTGVIDYCYIHVNYAGVEPNTVSYIGTGSSFTVGSNCYLFSVDSLVPKRIINKTYENDLADILNDWCNLNGSEYKKWTYDAAGNIEFQ